MIIPSVTVSTDMGMYRKLCSVITNEAKLSGFTNNPDCFAFTKDDGTEEAARNGWRAVLGIISSIHLMLINA
ncbi:MAG: hypothetical protein LBJ47_05405 [Tannerella sp.]|jgi:hypothetical protein|nr:hypothetical protein [Tannerella sp.]